MKHTKKLKILPLVISESHPCSNSCNVCHLLSFLPYEKASFSNWFVSNDGETHSRRPHSPEVDKPSETEGVDANKAEGDDFDEEEEGEDSASGSFLDGGEDFESIVSVGREEVNIDCELIPIMREESSITGQRESYLVTVKTAYHV